MTKGALRTLRRLMDNGMMSRPAPTHERELLAAGIQVQSEQVRGEPRVWYIERWRFITDGAETDSYKRARELLAKGEK